MPSTGQTASAETTSGSAPASEPHPLDRIAPEVHRRPTTDRQIPADVVALDRARPGCRTRLRSDRSAPSTPESSTVRICVGVRVVPPVERLHHHHVGGPRGVGDESGVVGVGGERLLAQHVLAGLDRGDRPLTMQRRGRADVHRVDGRRTRSTPRTSRTPAEVPTSRRPAAHARDRGPRPRPVRPRRRRRPGRSPRSAAIREAATRPMRMVMTGALRGRGRWRSTVRCTCGGQ